MQQLSGKHIVLGITGGIAAYKSAELTRRLGDAGAEVRVMMTPTATAFVTPLTFQALSGHSVHTELIDTDAEAAMGHIELARWADAILIAPASANTIARLAQGRAEDLLTTVCLATEAPIAFAPAMNRVMWQDPATQHNCNTLVERGYRQLGPAAGAQACGETGEGRLLDVHDLLEQLAAVFQSGDLQALKVVVTAGPTREPIDPVRYIGNRSSGKMGFALARAAQEAGASVTLVSGPVALPTPDNVKRIDVETAAEMFAAVHRHMGGCDIFISAAAVADYRPASVFEHKIKKQEQQLSIDLVRNEDIVASVAALRPGPFVVGFAAETGQLENNARDKLEKKNLDMIAANPVGHIQHGDSKKQDIGFNSEYNTLSVFWRDGEQYLTQAKKYTLARQLIKIIAHRFNLNKQDSKNTA